MTLSRALLLPLMTTWLMTNHIEAVDASDVTSTTTFDISDIVSPIGDFPGALDPGDAPATESASTRSADRQGAFLHRIFEPGVADLISTQSTFQGSTLVVTGSRTLIDHISAVLSHVRAQRRIEIHTDYQSVMVDPKVRQDHDALKELPWKDLPGRHGLAFAVLTSVQHQALIARLDSESGVTLPYHPSITSLSGQQANCTFKSIYSYPKLEFTARGPSIGEGTRDLGVALNVRATASDDLRFIHLVMEHESVTLLNITSVTLGMKLAGSGNTVEEPQLWRTHEHLDQEIEDGASVIITTGLYLEKDQPPRIGFLIVTGQILRAPADGPDLPGAAVTPHPQLKQLQADPGSSIGPQNTF